MMKMWINWIEVQRRLKRAEQLAIEHTVVRRSVKVDAMYRETLEQDDAVVAVVMILHMFQTVMITMSLVAGIASLVHIACFRSKGCANAGTLFALICAGFCHMLACAYMLAVAQESAIMTDFFRPGYLCWDYSLSAKLANAVFGIYIVHNIILNNTDTNLDAGLAWIVGVGSILTGLFMTWSFSQTQLMLQTKVLSLIEGPEQNVNIFWSVCDKHLNSEMANLMIEYGLVYLPVVAVVSWVLVKKFRCTRDFYNLSLVILSNKECATRSETCDCEKMNEVLVPVLKFSAILLLIAKPGYLLYERAYSNSDFRDVIPSLMQIAVFASVCIEYILKHIFKQERDNFHDAKII